MNFAVGVYHGLWYPVVFGRAGLEFGGEVWNAEIQKEISM